jgi:hypothetical protein
MNYFSEGSKNILSPSNKINIVKTKSDASFNNTAAATMMVGRNVPTFI